VPVAGQTPTRIHLIDSDSVTWEQIGASYVDPNDPTKLVRDVEAHAILDVNGNPISVRPNYSDTTPAAPNGETNVKFQNDSSSPTNISAHVPNTGGVNAQTGTSCTIGLAQRGKCTTLDNASPIAVTLDSSAPSSFLAVVQNLGAGAATLTPSSGTISYGSTLGASSMPLASGQGAVLFFDGTNWIAFTGGGSGGSDPDFTGDTGSGGAAGDVPAPPAGSGAAGYVLRADGTWGDPNFGSNGPIALPSAIAGMPGAGQLVLIYTAYTSEIFPANFASPNSYGSVGVNPTATATYSVYKNGVLVGTITISTAGHFTFATVGGASFTLNAGDRLTAVAPGSQDSTLSDVGFTLVGYRTGSIAAGSTPLMSWKGTYVGGTTYHPYDVVAYTVSGKVQSYVCKATTTGNLPTNATYWDLLAQAGADGTLTPANAQQQTYTYALDTGTANHYAVSLATAPTIVDGSIVCFRAANACTGASDLAVQGGTAFPIKKQGNLALAAGDIAAKQAVIVFWNSTDSVWEMVGGGGGGDTTAKYIIGAADATLVNAVAWPALYNHPDVPPASPNAMDDEFDGTSLDPKWTIYNPASIASGNIALTFGQGWMFNEFTVASVVTRCYGFIQPISGSAWKFRTKCALEGLSWQFLMVGLIVRNSAANKNVTWTVGFVNGQYGTGWLERLTGATLSSNVDCYNTTSNPFYMEVELNGSNILFRQSNVGISYVVGYTEAIATWLGSNPDFVGLCIFASGDSSTNPKEGLKAGFDWFRRIF
jgi:hypothetical protein